MPNRVEAGERPNPLPPPLFIIALPKSYTTVLGGILGQHPGVVSVPELNLFTGPTVLDWAMQPGHQVFCDGLLRTVAQFEFGMQTAESVSAALAWLQERADWPVTTLFDHLRQRVAPAILLDQSPLYTQRPAFLARIINSYPDARFIHLVRNPTAWVESMGRWGAMGDLILRMYSDPEMGLERPLQPLEIWDVVHDGIGQMLSGLPAHQRITICGEEVVTRPTRVIAETLDWLGLPYDDRTTEDMLHPERSVFASWGPPGARGGNNPDFLSSPHLRLRDDFDELIKIKAGTMAVPTSVRERARTYGYS